MYTFHDLCELTQGRLRQVSCNINVGIGPRVCRSAVTRLFIWVPSTRRAARGTAAESVCVPAKRSRLFVVSQQSGLRILTVV